MAQPSGSYDRDHASRILAELAAPGLFVADPEPSPFAAPGAAPVRYTASPLVPEPGSHLTFSQLYYLETFMKPCRPEQVTSATHRITWTDSAGVPNTGHTGPGPLGALVPVAVRETVLSLWRSLAANDDLAERMAALGDSDLDVLRGTTTDHEPLEILRIGVESNGRAVSQHALIAHQTSYGSAAELARGLAGSGLFTVVATQWYWELQASTFRRGMVPVTLQPQPNGTVRYTAESLDLLRRMKEATLADARAVMHRATTQEGLSVEQAVRRYHDDLDLISRQYALLPDGAVPRCLASMTHLVGDRRFTLLPAAVDRFVQVFAGLADRITVEEQPPEPAAVRTDRATDRVFAVPDMNCRHCRRTVQTVLEGLGVEVLEVSLETKRVVADFPDAAVQQQGFEAIRNSGYTVVTDSGR
jgi:copper chaperone CopZ